MIILLRNGTQFGIYLSCFFLWCFLSEIRSERGRILFQIPFILPVRILILYRGSTSKSGAMKISDKLELIHNSQLEGWLSRPGQIRDNHFYPGLQF